MNNQKPRFKFKNLILLLYGASMAFFSIMLKLCAPLSSSLSRQLQRRNLFDIPPLPNDKEINCIYFCSSAGEYEQALPVINCLRAQGYKPLIIFFSISGYNFARVREESAPYILAPLDLPWLWERLYQIIKPQFTIVVRHEFWPAFFATAAKYSRLYVINLTDRSNATFKKSWQKYLLQHASHLFYVSAPKSNPDRPLTITGDTKFDRVLERAQLNDAGLNSTSPTNEATKTLIIGSAWQADVDLIMSAYNQLDETLRQSLRVLVVPHDLSAKNCAIISEIFRKYGLRFKEVTETEDIREYSSESILLVNVMGKLAELYRVADLCFVGGGVHHRVHNVLEPAAYNLNIAYGPHFHTQQEAVDMAATGISTVCTTTDDALQWLKRALTEATIPQTKSFLLQRAGATSKICAQLLKEIL